MGKTWDETQEAAILSLLDQMVLNGETARSVRDMLTGERRAAVATAVATADVTADVKAYWDGLTHEMQETYRRTHADYADQLERAKLAQQSTEKKGNTP